MSEKKINYYQGNYPVKKRRIFGLKTLLFFIFLLVMGVILLSTFYKDISFGFIPGITGRVVGLVGNSNPVDVSIELTVPELNLKGDYSRIVIKGTSPSPLIAGGQQFSLQTMSSIEIIFEDFSGRIILNEGTVSVSSAKVSKIIFNGMPVSDKAGKKMKISMESPIFYDSLEFQDELSFKKLDYIASGTIIWGGDKIVRLVNEKVEIISFAGKMEIKNKIMTLEGVVKDIKGKNFRII